MDRQEELRVAHTEALFREVNERIAETAERYEADEAAFVCECGDDNCTHRVEATLDEYEGVRRDPTHFLLAAGHEDKRVERVVGSRNGFAVVKKVNDTVVAAVRRLDPRAEPA